MLKVLTNGETLTFTSAWEVADCLPHEEKQLVKDLHHVGWDVSGMKSSCARMDHDLLRVIEWFLGGQIEWWTNRVKCSVVF